MSFWNGGLCVKIFCFWIEVLVGIYEKENMCRK